MRSAAIVDSEMLGEILRDARTQRGLSQRQLAAELGLSQRYITEIEQGKPTKAVDRLFEYMRETGVQLYAEVSDE